MFVPGCFRPLQIALRAALASIAAAGAAAEPPAWRRADPPGLAGAPTALAVEGVEAVEKVEGVEAVGGAQGQGGRLALGDARGVLLGAGASWRRVAVRGAVRDLAFDPGGGLWIATARGLWSWHGDAGSLRDRSPGAGPRDRDLTRVVAVGAHRVAAGEGGAFVARGDAPWRRLPLPGSVQRVDAISIRIPGASPDSFELWLSSGGRLFGCRPDVGGGLACRTSRLPGSRVAVDLASHAGRLVALGEDWIAERRPGAPEAETTWSTRPLGGPPGARARRLVSHAGALWVATDRGLLRAAGPQGPWHREPGALGSRPVVALAAAGAELHAAAGRGLFALRAVAVEVGVGVGGNGHVAWRPRPGEPSVQLVHRVALAYLGLGPERMRSLQRGVDRRGWLPEVELRGSRELERQRRSDFDQAFLSGALRELSDRERDRSSDFGVHLTLSWDLGDVLYHPESLDVSKEARELLELRDDVLDEITQLYFERRRVLGSLAALGTDAGAEAARLRLRADELAAGLDAWTGGWFGRQAAPLAR